MRIRITENVVERSDDHISRYRKILEDLYHTDDNIYIKKEVIKNHIVYHLIREMTIRNEDFLMLKLQLDKVEIIE